jgi:basic membrane protein A and related proteins
MERRTQEMIAGHFDVFWGPIKEQTGNVRIAAGEKPADDVSLRMDWFVEGVGRDCSEMTGEGVVQGPGRT